MKKIFLLIPFLLLTLITIGQTYPILQNLGRTPTTLVATNSIKADQGLILGTFTDTTAANLLPYLKYYVGAMVWTTSDSSLWVRQKSLSTAFWFKVGGAGGGATGSFWNLTGNYMVNIPAFFGIGTNSNDALPIKTTNITRLVVPADGIANSTTSTDSVLIRKANLEMGVISKAALVGSAGWSLTGNSGLTAGTNFLGTTDATDVVFKRNSSEIMRINATGLGIGSTNPTEKLHVAGNFRLVNGSQVKGNYLSTDANGLSIWRFLVVNVRDYGATGDGVTDDITAIRAATLAAGQSGKIFFPNGTYAISDSINSEFSGQVFEGRGATIKLLNKRHGFKLRHDSCSVIGFKMVGNGSVNTLTNEGIFVLIQGASYCKVKDNILTSGSSSAIGVIPGATYHGTVRAETSPNYNEVSGNIIKGLPGSDTSYSTGHSGILINYASLLPCNTNIVSNNTIYGNNSFMNGIALIGAGHSNLITTNTVKNCREYGIMLYSSDGQPDNAVTKNTIANNIIDSIGSTGTDKGMGVYLQKTVGSIVTGNHISHTEIGATTASLAQGGITVGYSLNAVISSNVIDSIMTDYPAIFVTSSFFVNLENNIMSDVYIGLRVQSSSNVNSYGNRAISRNSTVYASTGLSSSSNPAGYASIATGKELSFTNNNFSALAGNPFYFEGSATYPFYFCNVAANTITTVGTGMLGTYLRKSNITGNVITGSGSGNGMQWNDTNDSLYIAENNINRTSGSFTYGIYSDGPQNTINWNKVYNSSTPVSSLSVASSNFFGFMGVNTSSPSTLFHINGAAGFRYVDGNQGSGKVLQSDANGVGTWTTPSTVATAVPLSGITAATTTAGINSGSNYINWAWNSIAGGDAFEISSTSTAAAGSAQRLFIVNLNGTNATSTQTTIAASIANGHAGTSSTNIGANFSAINGTINNAINIQAGALTLNNSAGTSGQVLTSSGANTLPTWTTPTTYSGTNFILNQTGQQASSNFNISGAAVIGTSATVPLIIGSTSTTGDLNLQTTSGVGTTGADMHFLVGNNGATEAMTILNNANVGIGTNPSVKLDVLGSATSGVNIVGKFVGGTSASAGGIQIGNYTGTYGGVWSNNVTPSTINFLLASDGAVSYFNATNNAITSINGNTVVNTTSTGSAITGTLGATGDVGLSTTSAGIVTIGGGATASKLRFMEPSGSGSNYSEFQAQAQAGNITYTLPNANAVGQLTNDGSGGLSWAAGGGGSSLFPTTGTGTATGAVTGDLTTHSLAIITDDGAKFSLSGDRSVLGNDGGDDYVAIDIGANLIISSGLGITLTPTPVTIDNLAGTGTRAVLASAAGLLSAPVSDRSTKENIHQLNTSISTLMKLKPVSFEYRDEYKTQFGTGTQIGFIAQDIQKVLPNSVYYNTAGLTKGKMGYNETDLIPVLVKSLQEAVERIESLEKEVKKLKNK